ncbi:hypothetical protein GFD17_07975 [Bifidobacterium sp. SMB2]|uniref:Uncharacterized protein n=1 Tax=Bifidobacterium saimiriisciurei TaxID=2661627 RepID=A0ABX0CG20_9BIFI|nr:MULTISPECIES: hypothetical protein [Bifidobacterium]NEG96688.1 hypothetical protein [Bifidobacterium sp. SMB2]NEH11844.1 hypothetical protein [Bifidobacterium saimiriisciurei]
MNYNVVPAPNGVPAMNRWPRSVSQLRSTTLNPDTFTPVTGRFTPTGIDLNDPRSQRLLDISRRAARALEQRDRLINRLRDPMARPPKGVTLNAWPRNPDVLTNPNIYPDTFTSITDPRRSPTGVDLTDPEARRILELGMEAARLLRERTQLLDEMRLNPAGDDAEPKDSATASPQPASDHPAPAPAPAEPPASTQAMPSRNASPQEASPRPAPPQNVAQQTPMHRPAAVPGRPPQQAAPSQQPASSQQPVPSQQPAVSQQSIAPQQPAVPRQRFNVQILLLAVGIVLVSAAVFVFAALTYSLLDDTQRGIAIAVIGVLGLAVTFALQTRLRITAEGIGWASLIALSIESLLAPNLPAFADTPKDAVTGLGMLLVSSLGLGLWGVGRMRAHQAHDPSPAHRPLRVFTLFPAFVAPYSFMNGLHGVFAIDPVNTALFHDVETTRFWAAAIIAAVVLIPVGAFLPPQRHGEAKAPNVERNAVIVVGMVAGAFATIENMGLATQPRSPMLMLFTTIATTLVWLAAWPFLHRRFALTAPIVPALTLPAAALSLMPIAFAIDKLVFAGVDAQQHRDWQFLIPCAEAAVFACAFSALAHMLRAKSPSRNPTTATIAPIAPAPTKNPAPAGNPASPAPASPADPAPADTAAPPADSRRSTWKPSAKECEAGRILGIIIAVVALAMQALFSIPAMFTVFIDVLLTMLVAKWSSFFSMFEPDPSIPTLVTMLLLTVTLLWLSRALERRFVIPALVSATMTLSLLATFPSNRVVVLAMFLLLPVIYATVVLALRLFAAGGITTSRPAPRPKPIQASLPPAMPEAAPAPDPASQQVTVPPLAAMPPRPQPPTKPRPSYAVHALRTLQCLSLLSTVSLGMLNTSGHDGMEIAIDLVAVLLLAAWYLMLANDVPEGPRIVAGLVIVPCIGFYAENIAYATQRLADLMNSDMSTIRYLLWGLIMIGVLAWAAFAKADGRIITLTTSERTGLMLPGGVCAVGGIGAAGTLPCLKGCGTFVDTIPFITAPTVIIMPQLVALCVLAAIAWLGMPPAAAKPNTPTPAVSAPAPNIPTPNIPMPMPPAVPSPADIESRNRRQRAVILLVIAIIGTSVIAIMNFNALVFDGRTTYAPVTPPELPTLTFAAAALAVGGLLMRRDAALRSWRALGLGLIAAMLPSLLLVWIAPTPSNIRIVVVGTMALAAIIVGAVRGLQAPLLCGTVVLAAHVLVQLWPAISAFSAGYWWVWLALAGITLIVVAAFYERSLKAMRTLGRRIRDLR